MRLEALESRIGNLWRSTARPYFHYGLELPDGSFLADSIDGGGLDLIKFETKAEGTLYLSSRTSDKFRRAYRVNKEELKVRLIPHGRQIDLVNPKNRRADISIHRSSFT